ncbi:ATP-dependent 6-phosphofructokinase [Desulfogranum japonicum]|uniref:ATP-dependent 6-phosphofructokinase n=1 Tax=Desulfogranum japonicum TaxID=231447 RepID=UPI00041B60AA|nr:ATP-dependent 6-phosphofructokinase [Desulfogranum japonicum]
MDSNQFDVQRLGECRYPSPMQGVCFTDDSEKVLYHSHYADLLPYIEDHREPPGFSMAGPRENIYFDPATLSCGIVTCGGLCPGLNDVIRSLVLSLHHHYKVKRVLGFRYGYEGLNPAYYHRPIELSPEVVDGIHQQGGSVLGSSRGPQDVKTIVDTLVHLDIGILFAIGGDGTLRGAAAIVEEIERRGLKIALIGIPKTIDNDISNVDFSFGYETAVAESRHSTYTAHVEAVGARNGIGLVKLMGRESGFIAASAALANNEVNFCLIPEVEFSLEGLLSALERRLRMRGHAVIVVGEGAGQTLFCDDLGCDLSGNRKLGDIGLLLRDRIKEHFKCCGVDITLKYIDPSYMIRSMPASAYDSAFCLQLGHNAVHAGMAGFTNVLIGHWNNYFTHVPIPMAVADRKKVDPKGRLWSSVVAATGQPVSMI